MRDFDGRLPGYLGHHEVHGYVEAVVVLVGQLVDGRREGLGEEVAVVPEGT